MARLASTSRSSDTLCSITLSSRARRVRKFGSASDAVSKSGAATSVFAATAPELEGRGGLYLEDCHVAAVNDDPETREGVRSYAVDPAAAGRLRAISEELVGQGFPLVD